MNFPPDTTLRDEPCDIAVIGCGAAGLMAAIAAGRASAGRRRIIGLDGAARIGAKILVAGGGRCNVTHHHVDESAYAGSSPHAIRNVLGRFPADATVSFFRDLGVELKREDTGKLFPVSDDAHTVLDALLRAVREAGVELRHPARVGEVRRDDAEFLVTYRTAPTAEPRALRARRVIVATGGKSLPKTGSDGAGYDFVRSLGHSITPRVFPALVPLLLPATHWLCQLSGITADVTLDVRTASGKKLKSFTNSLLLTHFGLSGPAALDISRYWSQEAAESVAAGRPAPVLSINWTVSKTTEEIDHALQRVGPASIGRWMQSLRVAREGSTDGGSLPQRLVKTIADSAGIDPESPGHSLTREARRGLAETLTQTIAPVTGDRGYLFAEVTAGGVPLKEIRLDSMESRLAPGLHLCGEICDVDGRIGGFNFQWAWASGWVAGTAAAGAMSQA